MICLQSPYAWKPFIDISRQFTGALRTGISQMQCCSSSNHYQGQKLIFEFQKLNLSVTVLPWFETGGLNLSNLLFLFYLIQRFVMSV